VSRDHLHVDARLLTVDVRHIVPSSEIMVDSSYPSGYFEERCVMRRTIVMSVFTILLGSCSSCRMAPPNPSCGKFTDFRGSTDANRTGQAALFQLYFSYAAAGCPCQCGKYWFVQAIRPLDLDTGGFIHPNDTQQDRMVTGQTDEFFNGWAVDRLEGRKLGYYAVNDDFTLPPPVILGEVNRFGSGTTSAALHDTLARGDRRSKAIQIVGLTVAVCVDSASPCTAKILGIEKWMVVFGGDGTVTAPQELPADTKDAEAFRLAVQAWNDHLDDRIALPSFSFP
jgi:hypothetical protein